MAGRKSKAVAKRSPSQAKADAFDEKLAAAQMARVQVLAASHTDDAIRCLVECATATVRQMEPNAEGYFEPVIDEETGDPIRLSYLPGPRTSAAKALLEHAHGRPTQRVQHDGVLGASRITVVLQSFGPSGEQTTIDVTPTPEEISGGADPPAERMAS